MNRATRQGYMKSIRKECPVKHKNESIGMKKTLIFYGGYVCDITNWVMHEYRMCDRKLGSAGVLHVYIDSQQCYVNFIIEFAFKSDLS